MGREDKVGEEQNFLLIIMYIYAVMLLLSLSIDIHVHLIENIYYRDILTFMLHLVLNQGYCFFLKKSKAMYYVY